MKKTLCFDLLASITNYHPKRLLLSNIIIFHVSKSLMANHNQLSNACLVLDNIYWHCLDVLSKTIDNFQTRQQTVKSIFHLTAVAPDSKCPADSSGTSFDEQPEIGISPVSGRHQWRHLPSVGWHRGPVSPSHVTMTWQKRDMSQCHQVPSLESGLQTACDSPVSAGNTRTHA